MSQAAISVQTSDFREDPRSLSDYLTTAFKTSTTPASVARLDNGVLLAVNDAFCHLIGREPEQVIGCSSVELGMWKSHEERMSRIRGLYSDRMITLGNHSIQHSDGHSLTCKISVYPSVFAEQRCLVSIYSDLSPEIQVRKTQSDNRQIIDAAIAGISDGVCICHTDESLVQVNQAFLRLHGLSESAERISSLADLRKGFDVFTREGRWLPESERPPARASRGESASGEEVSVFSRVTGRTVHCSVSFSPIRSPSGEALGCIMLVRDIGDQVLREKRNLAQRIDLERLVSERTAELAAATRAAEAASLAKTQFVSHISHELRTPLHSIATIAGLLRHHPGSIGPGIIDALEAATNHLIGLIDTVLDLKRIEAGHLELGNKFFNLKQLLANVVAITRDQAWERGLELTVACDVDDTALIGDPQRLQQALLNYVGNAIKFTHRGRIEIRVSCQRESGDQRLLRLEVSDTGSGIAESALPRLFKPFERINSACSGSGLGLVITQKLAQLMGGEVGVRSEPNVGSTFWLTAQVRRQQPKRLSPNPSAAPTTQNSTITPDHIATQAHAGQFKGHILLAEDDPMSRGLLSQLLARWGFEVDTARDGVEAVERAIAVDYQLILMDMQMPGMDGPSAAVEINARRQGRWRPPILALTANAFEHDRRRCVAAGMCDFISKPISPKLLFERVEFWHQAASRHEATDSI